MLASHLFHLFDNKKRKQMVDDLCRRIKQSNVNPDFILVTGLSGCLIAPAVADLLKIQFVVVRNTMMCHSNYKVEGYRADLYRGIIVDDLVEQGNTVRHMWETLNKHCKECQMPMPIVQHVFCYDDTQQFDNMLTLTNRHFLNFNRIKIMR